MRAISRISAKGQEACQKSLAKLPPIKTRGMRETANRKNTIIMVKMMKMYLNFKAKISYTTPDGYNLMIDKRKGQVNVLKGRK
jgi:hypothetical protein